MRVRSVRESSRSPSTPAGPLSHFLAARRREPVGYDGSNPFDSLAARHPRAWACLQGLTDVFAGGGRQALRLPAAPLPQMPTDDEVVSVPSSIQNENIAIFSAIDERFDQRSMNQLRDAMSGKLVLCVSALSRYSRNSAKLHRILEFLLAHRATILTTNYLIRPGDVWVRRGELVKPISADPYVGLARTRGLVGAHRKLAENITIQLREATR